MMNRFVGLALIVPSALLLALAPTAGASSAKVGPLINVSDTDPLPPDCIGPNRDAEIEPTLAVKPRNSDRRVMAWMQSPNPQALAIVSANSNDGGRVWRQVLVPDNTRCTGGELEVAIHPWLSYGPKGKVYLSSLAFSGDDPDLGVTVNRSNANGASWSEPVFVGGTNFKSQETITADPVRAGTAYLLWRGADTLSTLGLSGDLHFSRSEDGGRTWSEPVAIYETELAPPFETVVRSDLVATGPGRLVAVFSTATLGESRNRLLAMRSNDGGESWSAPTEFADPREIQPRDPDTDAPIRYGSYFFGADGGPGHGVFVAYQAPQSATESKIMVVSSKRGRNWSEPRLASEGAVSPFMPDLALDRNGTLALRFYDLRNDVTGDGELTTDSWFRHSHDGGRSWKERKLGAGFDLSTAPVSVGGVLPGYNLGEYQGLAPTHNGFATAFTRAKPAAVEGATDIFYTSVKVKPGRACRQAKKQVRRAKKQLKRAKKSGKPQKIKRKQKKLRQAKQKVRKRC